MKRLTIEPWFQDISRCFEWMKRKGCEYPLIGKTVAIFVLGSILDLQVPPLVTWFPRVVTPGCLDLLVRSWVGRTWKRLCVDMHPEDRTEVGQTWHETSIKWLQRLRFGIKGWRARAERELILTGLNRSISITTIHHDFLVKCSWTDRSGGVWDKVPYFLWTFLMTQFLSRPSFPTESQFLASQAWSALFEMQNKRTSNEGISCVFVGWGPGSPSTSA